MWVSSWLRSRHPSDATQHGRRSPVKPGVFRPRLEALEGRDVPSTLHVTSTLDDGSAGSLRDEIFDAHSGDTIVFDPSLAGQQILLSGLELYVNKSLAIQGLPTGSVINGGGLSRVFDVGSGVNVTLTNLTVTGGIDIQDSANAIEDATAGEGAGILNHGTLTVQNCKVTGNTGVFGGNEFGGGIYNALAATLTVTGSTVSGNSAASGGGGIYNAGTLTVTGSLLSGNTAWDGGGIDNAYRATATVLNCTITGNTAGYEGGGIYNTGRLTVGGTAFSANTPDDIFGGYTNKKGNTFG